MTILSDKYTLKLQIIKVEETSAKRSLKLIRVSIVVISILFSTEEAIFEVVGFANITRPTGGLRDL